MTWRNFAAMTAALLVLACKDSPTDDGDDRGPDPGPAIQLAVLGNGGVPERYTSEVAVAGDWVYTGTWNIRGTASGNTPGNALKIWNASGGTPVLADSVIIPGAGTVSDVQLSHDNALLVLSIEGGTLNRGISIYDRNPANPAKPTLLSRYSTTLTSTGVHTVKLGRINNRHYAFLSVNQGGGSPSRLIIVDLTDPVNPVQVYTAPMGGPFIHDVAIRDGILFAALWEQGLRIFDVGGGGRGGTPSDPVVMGNIVTVNGKVHNVNWFHDPKTGSKRYAFIGEETPASPNYTGDIHVVDVSNFTAPREVGFFRVAGAGAHNFALDEASGILYAAFYVGGVRALDIRGDLENCAAAEKAPDGRCDLGLMKRERAIGLNDRGIPVSIWGVAISGNALYASDMWNGLWRLDITQLKRP
ncbi:MAG: hypothetical protein WEE89_06775 [Gemmatimonadota bacterium]